MEIILVEHVMLSLHWLVVGRKVAGWYEDIKSTARTALVN